VIICIGVRTDQGAGLGSDELVCDPVYARCTGQRHSPSEVRNKIQLFPPRRPALRSEVEELGAAGFAEEAEVGGVGDAGEAGGDGGPGEPGVGGLKDGGDGSDEDAIGAGEVGAGDYLEERIGCTLVGGVRGLGPGCGWRIEGEEATLREGSGGGETEYSGRDTRSDAGYGDYIAIGAV